MKFKFFFFLSFLFVGSATYAQYFNWAISNGSGNLERGFDIALDGSGNVYTIGEFEGTVDFDPGSATFNLTSAGNTDFYIQKLDPTGNFIWAKSVGSSSPDYGRSIAVDGFGNVYTTSYFIGTVDFDPGTATFNLTSEGYSDIFIQKLDASGNFLWAKRIGSTGYDQANSIEVDAAGNSYSTGWFSGTVDFDPGAGTTALGSATGSGIFIQKLNPDGDLLWANSMDVGYGDLGRYISIDASSNVYCTGSFHGTVDFDPGAGTYNITAEGGSDVFIQKLDASGNFLWVKSIGSANSDQGTSLAVDASGNVFTTGFFLGTANVDPGASNFLLTPSGNDDIFIQKLDASGNFLWAKSIGSTGPDQANSIAVDAVGNVYATGVFRETVDFDPGAASYTITSAGSSDVFILKLDPAGNFLWATGMGSTSFDAGYSLTADASGNVLATGFFSGTTDFDPGSSTFHLSPAGNDDFFVVKLGVSSCVPNSVMVQETTGSFCAGDSIFLKAGPLEGGGFTYQWQVDGGSGFGNITDNAAYTGSNADSLVIRSLAAGSKYRLILSGNCGMPIASNEVQITEIPLPIVDLGPDTTVCALALVLDSGAQAESYLWNDGSTGPTLSPDLTGEYHLSLTNANGCKGSDTVFITVLPLPGITLGSDLYVRLGEQVSLSLLSSGALSYQWTPSTFLNDPQTEHPLSTPSQDMVYTLEVTSIDGCKATGVQKVFMVRDLFIPSGFTPDGDGTNDRWEIPDLALFPNATIEVFDRAGQKIFSGGPAHFWDGTHKGRPSPTGAYYFIIQTGISDMGTVTGNVSLIRLE